MKRKIAVFTVAILSIVTIGGLVACKHGPGRCGFDEFDLDAAINRIASRLDLTETQKADLDQKALEIAEKAKTLHGDRDARHQELANLVRQDVMDPGVVDVLIAERVEKMREMASFVSIRLIEFHSTLTPEQKEKIAQRIEEHASEGCRFGLR